MKLLAVDTSTLRASVAVVGDDRVVSERDALVTTHSERLLPLIAEVLMDAKTELRDMDVIACGAGPGSFTGLRIGLATAKGLAFALRKPLLMASSLAALALEALHEDGPVALALLDAKKQEVYAGLYRSTRTPFQAEALGPELVIAPERLAAHVGRFARPETVVVVGDGATVYPEMASACGRLRPGRGTPRASSVARLVLAHLDAGGRPRGNVDELVTAVPTYIRASEAELSLSTKPATP